MQPQALTALAAALIFGSTGALAQSGELAGVTMRVLDDLRDVDAVVLALDGDRSETETSGPAAAADAPDRETAAEAGERSRDATARDTDTAAAAADDARRAERRERAALHDTDADERGEGRLEDRDVERSTAPPPTVTP